MPFTSPRLSGTSHSRNGAGNDDGSGAAPESFRSVDPLNALDTFTLLLSIVLLCAATLIANDLTAEAAELDAAFSVLAAEDPSGGPHAPAATPVKLAASIVSSFDVEELSVLRPKKGTRKESAMRYYMRKTVKIAKHLSRLAVLSLYFAPAVLTLPICKFVPAFRHTWWNLLVHAIERSGAAFVKFGQWAASRSDLFSDEVCDQLGRLRSKAPEHSLKVSKALFKEAFGVDLDTTFADLDEEPVASGSIAQVYRARLPDDHPNGPIEVAVKVRHPWVVDQIHTDLLLLYWMAKQLTSFRAFQWMELPVSIREFAYHLASQVDLTMEAKNLNRFVENFKDIESVKFPRPVMASESVLVETWEEGAPITQYVVAKKNPLNPRLARMGFTTFMKMLLVDNFIHADCHSENILVRLNQKMEPTIVMLDVGLVTSLNKEDNDCIVNLMKVLIFSDAKKAADVMVNLSARQHIEYEVDVPLYHSDMLQTFQKVFAIPDEQRQLGRTMTEVFAVMRRHHVKMQSNLALLAVSMGVLEGLARRLDPGINLLPVAAPYLFYNTSFGRALSQLAAGVRLDKPLANVLLPK
jgi:aarF domain-containing kinase